MTSISFQQLYGTLDTESGNLSSISHLKKSEKRYISISRLLFLFLEMQSRHSRITPLILQMELEERWFSQELQQVWGAMLLLAHLQLGNLVWEPCLRVWPRNLGSRIFMWLMWVFFLCGCLINGWWYLSFSRQSSMEVRSSLCYAVKRNFTNWHRRNFNRQYTSASPRLGLGGQDSRETQPRKHRTGKFLYIF